MAETRVFLKQREAVTLRFNVQDRQTGAAVNLSSAVGCTFTIKSSPWATTTLISKAATGTTVELTAGIVSCSLSHSDLNVQPGLYYSELFMDISMTHKRKSPDILLDIRQSISS